MADRKLKSISKQSKTALKKHPKLAVRDLANFKGIAKSEAVLEYVKELRVQPKLDEMDEKTNTPKAEMPWSPDLKNFIRCPADAASCMVAADHRRYVAIVSNFLQPNPSFRFGMNKLELEGLDHQLRAEREKYEECIREHILRLKNSPFQPTITGSTALFAHRQRGKILDAFGNSTFSEVVSRVSWPTLADENVQAATYRLKRIQTICEGRQNRIRFPDVRRRCQYFMNDRAIDQYFTSEAPQKIKLVDDAYALELSLNIGLEYVLEASTLRQLLVDGWSFRNETFCFRVSVIRRVRNGMTHRVCFFSKPILASRMELLHVQRQFMKWSVKAEVRRRAENQRNVAKTGKATANVPSTSAAADSTASLVRAIADASRAAFNEPTTAVGPGNHTAMEDDKNDLLGGILGSMGIFSAGAGDSAPKMKTSVSTENAFNAAAAVSSSSTTTSTMSEDPSAGQRYRYETVSLTADDKRSVLVRTSNHGVDQEGKPVSITVRNEYLPEAGAQAKCDEERLWNCVTATLKDATEHVNLHMYPRNGHCVQMQRYEPARHFSEMDLQLKQKLWTRIRRVCDLFNELDNLDIGEYLIMQDGESLKILQEHNAYMDSTMDENKMETDEQTRITADTILAACQLDQQPLPPNGSVWTGVDAHLPLVWQIVYGRIPGSFLPPGHKFHKIMQEKGPREKKHDPNKKMSKSQKRKIRKAETMKKMKNGALPASNQNKRKMSPKKESTSSYPTPTFIPAAAKFLHPSAGPSSSMIAAGPQNGNNTPHAHGDNGAMAVDTKPNIKKEIGETPVPAPPVANPPTVRRFKRPGEKPPSKPAKDAGGRETVKYDDSPFS